MYKVLIVCLLVLVMLIGAAPMSMSADKGVCGVCKKAACVCETPADKDNADKEMRDGDEKEDEDGDDEEEWGEEDKLEFAEIENEVYIFLKKNVPAAVDRLARLGKEDKDEYVDKIYELGDMIEQYYDGLEHNPEAARAWLASVKMDIEIDALVDKIRKADVAARKELEEKLKVLLDKAFDLRLADRQAELNMLKEEVSEIESMIEKRKKNKQKIIDRHFLELVQSDDEEVDLEW